MKAFTAPKLALATAIAATVGATAPAMAQLEEVLVTAQKRVNHCRMYPLPYRL